MVHLLPGRSNDAVIKVAGDLSRRCDARLIGIAAAQPVPIVYSDGFDNGAVMEACREEMVREIQDAKAEFHAAFSTAKYPIEWRSAYTCSALSGHLSSEARCADVIVTGLTSTTAFDSARHVDVGDLIMHAGRPVVVVPHAATRFTFDRVVVAWKDSREARRVVCDAIPLLKATKHVTIVEIAEEGDVPTALGRVDDVATWLASHGIKTKTLAAPSTGDASSQLEAILREHDADLVVAGAYGHSRLREWAFGGVTRSILHGTRCALLSH